MKTLDHPQAVKVLLAISLARLVKPEGSVKEGDCAEAINELFVSRGKDGSYTAPFQLRPKKATRKRKTDRKDNAAGPDYYVVGFSTYCNKLKNLGKPVVSYT